jgi:hypothetical protein
VKVYLLTIPGAKGCDYWASTELVFCPVEIFRISKWVTLPSVYRHKKGFRIIKKSILALSIFNNNSNDNNKFKLFNVVQ